MNTPECLLATVDFPPAASGGIARYYFDLCREGGGRISVVAPRCPGSGAFDKKQTFGVDRVRVPSGSSLFSRMLLTALMALYTTRCILSGEYKRLVVGHWFLLLGLIVPGKLFRLHTAIIMHGGELSRFRDSAGFRRLIIAIINLCDSVIVNSSYTCVQLTTLGVRHSKIMVLTPGVDTHRFDISSDCPHQNGDLALDTITLLTVATLVERKGHSNVISVLLRIVAKYPSTRYVIIGDGPCRPKLEALTDELGLAPIVSFLGRAPDEEVIRWMHACHIFVMPSRYIEGKSGEEGFGIVYLEANACGKPVVGGASGGVQDAVIDGITGLLVDPEDRDALFEALAQLIGRKDLRDNLGQKGKERVVNEFQWRDRVEALLGSRSSI